MKLLLPDIWQWSWFSEEKQLDFNGLFFIVGEHRVLVDPPPLTPEARGLLRRTGPIDYIIVTNRDHERETTVCQNEFHCEVRVPAEDAPCMGLKPTRVFRDGELLPGGIWVVQLKGQKSPGESALYLERDKGVLIVGDALIGKPAGSVSMLPAERYADIGEAKMGLRRLLKYEFHSLLVGDGVSILAGAKQQVERFLSI